MVSPFMLSLYVNTLSEKLFQFCCQGKIPPTFWKTKIKIPFHELLLNNFPIFYHNFGDTKHPKLSFFSFLNVKLTKLDSLNNEGACGVVYLGAQLKPFLGWSQQSQGRIMTGNLGTRSHKNFILNRNILSESRFLTKYL